MNVDEPGTTVNPFVASQFHCPHSPNFSWYSEDTTFHSIFAAILSIFSPAIVFLNFLVIVAVKRRKELKRQSYILLSSMAIADLLAGLVSVPLTIAFDLTIVFQAPHSYICKLRLASEFLTFSFVWVSLYHLTVIGWERYVAVRKWRDYKVIVTRGRVKKLAIFTWLLAVFTAFPPLIMFVTGVDQKFKIAWHIGESVCTAVCLILIAVFYVMVYLGARKRTINEISHVTALVKAKLASKVAKTTGMLTVALIVSFFPMSVVGLGAALPGFRKRVTLRFAETVIQLNSLASPVLYCYRDRRFRNAVLEMLRIRKPQQTQPHVGVVAISRREENRIPVTRSQPSDKSVVLKRSRSAPSIVKTTGSCFDGQPLKQPSSSVETSAMQIHTESGMRNTTSKNNQSGMSNSVDNPESMTHPVICRRKRLKSWDVAPRYHLGTELPQTRRWQSAELQQDFEQCN